MNCETSKKLLRHGYRSLRHRPYDDIIVLQRADYKAKHGSKSLIRQFVTLTNNKRGGREGGDIQKEEKGRGGVRYDELELDSSIYIYILLIYIKNLPYSFRQTYRHIASWQRKILPNRILAFLACFVAVCECPMAWDSLMTPEVGEAVDGSDGKATDGSGRAPVRMPFAGHRTVADGVARRGRFNR